MQALGRKPDEYILDSYRGLFLRYRDEMGLTGSHMVFDPSENDAPILLTGVQSVDTTSE